MPGLDDMMGRALARMIAQGGAGGAHSDVDCLAPFEALRSEFEPLRDAVDEWMGGSLREEGAEALCTRLLAAVTGPAVWAVIFARDEEVPHMSLIRHLLDARLMAQKHARTPDDSKEGKKMMWSHHHALKKPMTVLLHNLYKKLRKDAAGAEMPETGSRLREWMSVIDSSSFEEENVQ